MKRFFDRLVGGSLGAQLSGLEARPAVGRLMETALQCFQENGWRYRTSDRPGVIHFGFAGTDANYDGVIAIEEDDEEILVLLWAPTKVPEDKRLAVAEFIARANYGMKFGAFELDFSDGELRFKMSAILREGQLSPPMVHAMIGIAFTMLDRHYGALLGVCFGQ